MFDQACFGQYGQFQAGIGGLSGRMGCFVSRSWDCGKSTFLLFDWDSMFESSENITWLSIPGLLTLSSIPLTAPLINGIDLSFTGPYSADVGDINGDGLPDIIVGGVQADEFCVWLADGQGGWNRETISLTAEDPIETDITDIDGDNDILCCTYTGGRILLYLNDGGNPPQWTEVEIENDFPGGHDVEAWDMDDDGDPDVLGAAAEGDRVAWWRNDGGSPIQWVEQDIDTDIDYPCSIQAVDLDGDSCIDVIASTWLGDKVVAWYGSLDAVITCRTTNKIYWFELTEFTGSGWLQSSILDTEEDPQWASMNWDPTRISRQEELPGPSISLPGGNPVDGVLILEVHGIPQGNADIMVFDCSGRLVWSAVRELDGAGCGSLQVPNLPDGTYRVLMQQNEGGSALLPVVMLRR